MFTECSCHARPSLLKCQLRRGEIFQRALFEQLCPGMTVKEMWKEPSRSMT